jgi:hypothetical protein
VSCSSGLPTYQQTYTLNAQTDELETLLRLKEESLVKLETTVSKLNKRISILERDVKERDEELDRASEEHAADLERAQVLSTFTHMFYVYAHIQEYTCVRMCSCVWKRR